MRNILIYFAIKYHGDQERMLEAIRSKEKVGNDKIEEVKALNINAITILDDEYPNYFKDIFNPPLVIFYKGDITLLKKEKRLAVIGARENTDYGKNATIKILSELLQEKEVTIVSGLARGIDTIAHSQALKYNQKTIAVLGCGIDECYPKENISIYNEISKKGLIISEYPLDEKPDASHFPKRNRLISAISEGILVSEAHFKSGTQITVKYGLEQGKDIFAIPGSILEESFCNELISQGAIPVIYAKDIINQLF